MNRLCQKYNIKFKFNWYDLMKVYIKNNIVMKGCFSFGLKDIARNLYKHKIIDLKWEDEEINGKDAIVVANKANELCKNNYINNISEYKYMNIITKYNEIDCKILSVLHN